MALIIKIYSSNFLISWSLNREIRQHNLSFYYQDRERAWLLGVTSIPAEMAMYAMATMHPPQAARS
jgi:hypothetical protein